MRWTDTKLYSLAIYVHIVLRLFYEIPIGISPNFNSLNK
jgi:hypothetical protein